MIKIYIQEPLISDIGYVEIFVVEKHDGKTREYTQAESGLLNVKVLEGAGEKVQPFLKLPVNFFQELLAEMVKHATHKGIKTDSESVLQGKFTATEKHLEDMRKLVFKENSTI